MEKLFELYSNLAACKHLEECIVSDLRDIKYEWKINEEVIEEFEVPVTLQTASQCHQVNEDVETENFLDEVDRIIAKAQESIKQDYMSVKKSTIKCK